MKQCFVLLMIATMFLGCTGTQTIDQIQVTNNDVPEPAPNQEQVIMLKVTGMT